MCVVFQVAWDVPVDLFFYREPEELEKAEEAQAPFQEPAAVAAPGWGAEPMVGAAGAAPTPMEGFGQPAVDPTAVPMEYQAPPQAAAIGAGWDSAPAVGEEVAVEQQQPVQEAMPVEAAMPAAPATVGGWGDGGASQGGGW